MNHIQSNPRISKLSVRRSELKSTERFQEAIPLQLEIIELLASEGAPSNDLATAHNMASVLFFGAHRYSDAEWHARRALSLHTGDSVRDHEAYGAYHLVMARILASRLAFQEAALFGERAILEYSQFHNPPDEFLSFVMAEVERIKNHPWASMKVADNTDAGNGSDDICRVIDASRSPSPDPKGSPNFESHSPC